MDETLIHSKRDEDDDIDLAQLVYYYGENFANLEPDCFVEMQSPDSSYGRFKQGIFIRPYLQECLRAVNIDYEVAIFTAGYDWYANPIIDKIDPTGTLIQHRFFRHHTKSIEYQGQTSLYKDLTVFEGLDLTRTLIVDNQVFSFATHLSNGIPIANFYGNKKDSELIKVMKYVHEIAREDNLQLANERKFQLLKMLHSPIDKFAQYYQIDEMSSSDEHDFEEDGMTITSSPRVHNNVDLFHRDHDGEISLNIQDSEEEIRLNESFENESLRQGRSPQQPANGPIQGCSNLRQLQLRVIPVSDATPPSPGPANTTKERLHYEIVSKKDEGNIGGTLSNIDQQDSSAAMAFN